MELLQTSPQHLACAREKKRTHPVVFAWAGIFQVHPGIVASCGGIVLRAKFVSWSYLSSSQLRRFPAKVNLEEVSVQSHRLPTAVLLYTVMPCKACER